MLDKQIAENSIFIFCTLNECVCDEFVYNLINLKWWSVCVCVYGYNSFTEICKDRKRVIQKQKKLSQKTSMKEKNRDLTKK